MYNHNKPQQSKNRVHISWDILYKWGLDLIQSGLAWEAHFCKNAGLIADTYTIYGKIMIKDNHGHVSIVRTPYDLAEIKPRETATIAPGDDA